MLVLLNVILVREICIAAKIWIIFLKSKFWSLKYHFTLRLNFVIFHMIIQVSNLTFSILLFTNSNLWLFLVSPNSTLTLKLQMLCHYCLLSTNEGLKSTYSFKQSLWINQLVSWLSELGFRKYEGLYCAISGVCSEVAPMTTVFASSFKLIKCHKLSLNASLASHLWSADLTQTQHCWALALVDLSFQDLLRPFSLFYR